MTPAEAQRKTLFASGTRQRRHHALPDSLSRAPLPEPIAAFGTDEENGQDQGPVFGEPGFGELENKEAAPRRTEEETPKAEEEPAGTEAARQAAFAQRTADLREAAVQRREEQEEAEEGEEEEESPDGLSDVQRLARDGIDAGMGKIALCLPVIGHFLWWNVKMVWGGWIRKGRDPSISPFTFNDVLLIAAPSAPPTAKKAAGKIIPDAVMQALLVSADFLLLAGALFNLLLMIGIPVLYVYAITHPLEDLKWAYRLFGFSWALVKGAWTVIWDAL